MHDGSIYMQNSTSKSFNGREGSISPQNFFFGQEIRERVSEKKKESIIEMIFTNKAAAADYEARTKAPRLIINDTKDQETGRSAQGMCDTKPESLFGTPKKLMLLKAVNTDLVSPVGKRIIFQGYCWINWSIRTSERRKNFVMEIFFGHNSTKTSVAFERLQ